MEAWSGGLLMLVRVVRSLITQKCMHRGTTVSSNELGLTTTVAKSGPSWHGTSRYRQDSELA